ncbi:MAG: hypothetical protein HQK96_14040 [Nitrospirae bacterium]|nr:hypothetical protein [Nitrospirota bacterium]
MNIIIKIVEQKEQKFLTQGDWRPDEHGDMIITITKCPDWRHEAGIAVHELVELYISKNLGITIEQCDEFDAMYEEGYRSGKIPLNKEPGYDKKCPYFLGHVWGDRFSFVLLWLLGVKWKDYVRETDKLIEDFVKLN